jgi:DNA-binding transcriptional regulator LsrR (DeoR family)
VNDPEALSRLHSAVATYFLESCDFNGIAFAALAQQLGVSEEQMSQMLQAAITSGTVELSFASKTGNPHIKRLAAETVEVQRELLVTED